MQPEKEEPPARTADPSPDSAPGLPERTFPHV